tara:strand:- start:2123 stop:2422 length:300 start_codon:yes stop_codon:yes gene_type:complete
MTTTAEVERGHNYWGKDMFWIGESLTISQILNRFLELKEEFGLSTSRLAYSIGIAPSTLSRLFNKKHTANRTTLVALDVAISEWEDFYYQDYADEEDKD